MRLCLPEQVMVNAELGELPLSTKLSELSSPSYFAVHFSYLKATIANAP